MPRLAVDSGGKRHYLCPAHQDVPYVSVTTALKLGSEPYYPPGAADHGNAMHAAMERVLSGTDWRDTDGDLTALMVPGLEWLESWWQGAQDAYGFEVELIERTLFHHEHQYAGTLDALIRDGNGTRYVVDLKTQRDRDPAKWRLQMAAYAMAEEWIDDDGFHPVPAGITQGLVLWVPKAGAPQPLCFDIGERTQDAWLAVLTADRLLADTAARDGELLTVWSLGGAVA